MAVGILEARPPFVRFEVRCVEDRNATIDKGHFVGKDVIYALITPRGSKDVHEEVAEEWLAKLREEVRQGDAEGESRFPKPWFEAYSKAFQDFRNGVESSPDGMSLKNWPGISPAQLRTCHAIHLYTVEDLAAANEEAVMSLGMGGRGLRERAVEFLKASAGPGQASAQLVAQGEALKRLESRNQVLEQQVQSLLAMVPRDRMQPGPEPINNIGLQDILPKGSPPPRVQAATAALRKL